jgi:hypothetical protein
LIHNIKREFSRIAPHFEEDKMELSFEIKKQIEDSRKTSKFEMLTQEQVEKEFL